MPGPRVRSLEAPSPAAPGPPQRAHLQSCQTLSAVGTPPRTPRHPPLLTAWWLEGGRLFSTLGGTSYTSRDGSQPLGPLTAMGGVSYT